MNDCFSEGKAFIVLITSTLVSWLGALAMPMGLLVLCNIIDYGTGLAAATRRKEARSSARGFAGIAKKVLCWLLIVVGWIIDLMMKYFITVLGWALPLNAPVATLVCVWLVANELLSILENIADLGADLPPFLLPLVRWVKKRAEQEGEGKS